MVWVAGMANEKAVYVRDAGRSDAILDVQMRESEMDWGDPAARARLIESVGPDEYNSQHEAHHKASILEVYKGREIYPVSTRFGRLFAVGGTLFAFATIEAARRHLDATGEEDG